MGIDKFVAFKGVKESWLPLLDTPELDELLEKLDPNTVTPPPNCIFEFAKHTELQDVLVCCIGQDPYPKPGDAHGLAFSCLSGIPKSLRNIYKALLTCNLISEMPTSGVLVPWAKQGVLLLNTALTTEKGRDSAHISIWSDYTNALISAISEQKRVVLYEGRKTYLRPIFLLWGKHAQSKRVHINANCKIFEYAHPSPLQRAVPFDKCDHFIQVNTLLKKCDVPTIDWALIGATTTSVAAPKTLEQILELPISAMVAFTDGSCYPNNSCASAVAGFAVCIAYGPHIDTTIYGSIANRPHHATSQRAEGQAIYETMLFAKKHSDWTQLIIITDSNFWITMFQQYMPAWQARQLDFAEHKNSDMTVPMYNLYLELSSERNITFRHVESHNKSGWKSKPSDSYEKFCYDNNEYVDQLATYARVNLQPGKTVVSSVKYVCC